MNPAKRLDIYSAGGSETWTAEKDGLTGFDLHASGALVIYVGGDGIERWYGVTQIIDPPRVAAVRSFGTWLALEVDQEPPSPETGAQGRDDFPESPL